MLHLPVSSPVNPLYISFPKIVEALIFSLNVSRFARGVHGHQAIVFSSPIAICISIRGRLPYPLLTLVWGCPCARLLAARSHTFSIRGWLPPRGSCAAFSDSSQPLLFRTLQQCLCLCSFVTWSRMSLYTMYSYISFFIEVLLQIKNEWNKWKYLFCETKGGVGMSHHEK